MLTELLHDGLQSVLHEAYALNGCRTCKTTSRQWRVHVGKSARLLRKLSEDAPNEGSQNGTKCKSAPGKKSMHTPLSSIRLLHSASPS